MPETSRAYVPIFGDGIHGRNPNPQHLLCVFDLDKRALLATIDLRPYIAPHTLKLGPDGLIYITCENSAKVVVIDRSDQQGGGRDRFRLDQRPSPDHRAGRPAALHRERGGRHRLGDRPAEAKAARQDQDAPPARRHRDLGRRPHRGRGRRRRADAVPDRHRRPAGSRDEVRLKDVPKAAQIARYAPDNSLIGVTSLNSDTVSLIDPSFREQTAIKVGSQPMDMAFHGDELFVACQGDGSVHVIDIPNRRHKTSFQAGKGCESLGILLGNRPTAR